jgi:hypothetical protein
MGSSLRICCVGVCCKAHCLLSFFQSQVVEFAWTSIKEWEVDDEAMAFCFQYQRPEKNPRWVKIFTPYVSLFSSDQIQCFCTCFYVHFWAYLERKGANTSISVGS